MSLIPRNVFQPCLHALIVSMLALAPIACGEPADNGENGEEETPPNGTEPLEPDQCQNDEDLAWLHSSVSNGETGRDFAREKAGDCGLACVSASAPDECALRCMNNQGVELTDGCAGCYGFIVLCTINNCLQQCIDDPHSDVCDACQTEKGCNDEFYTCTGNLD